MTPKKNDVVGKWSFPNHFGGMDGYPVTSGGWIGNPNFQFFVGALQITTPENIHTSPEKSSAWKTAVATLI